MAVGQNIRARREAMNMQQMELADKLGVTKAFVSQIEMGRKQPPVWLCAAAAEILGCTIDELVNGKAS